MRSLFRKVKQSSSNSQMPVWWNKYWKKAEAKFVRVLSRYEAKASTPQKKKALLSFISLMTLVFSFWLYQGITGSHPGRHTWMKLLQSRPAPDILEDKLPPRSQSFHLYQDTLSDSNLIK